MSDKQTYEEAAFPVQSPRHTAFKIAFIYASISVIWILFSDQLLSIFAKDIETITRIQMVKGWFFVLATSYLIFFLLQKDIRKYCQVEEALRHSQEQLLSLMDALPIALSWADEQGNIQYSNNKFRELFGYALEDMPTVEQWFQLAYPDQEYRQTVASNWQIAVENAQNSGQEFAPIEVTITCKDGSTRYVAVVGTLLHDRILAVFNDLTESKQAEEALRESEEKYHKLFDTVSDTIMVFDAETREFIDANDAVLEMYGYSREEFLKLKHNDITAEPEESAESIEKTLNGEISRIPLRYHKRKDGTTFPVEISVGAFKLGNRQMAYGVVRDITERKHAIKALEKSEANFRSLVEFSPAAVSILKGEQIIYVNPAWQQMTGYSEEEAQRLDPFLIVHPEMREEIKQRALARYRGEQVPSRYEFKRITKDGEVKWADFSAALIEYDNEPAILTVSVDITDRKLAEEALQETEKKLEAIINHHFQLTGLLDVQGRLIMANETALKYHDVAESDVIGKLFWETPWWSHSKEEQDKLRKAIHMAAKFEFVRYETSHLNKNGELRTMDFSINPVIDDEGNVKYLIPEGRDITELKEAEKSLRQSEGQLRALANRLQEAEELARKALARELHDQVGQSLTALSINLNILRNRMPTDALEQLKERLDDSVELVEETTKTIRNVMSELRPSVLDDYGLTAALRWYGKRFSDRTGISIKLNMDEMSFRLAETVESALFRITQEALTNVAKHANASELVLTFEESDGQFRLIIADNGKGFDYAAFSKAEVRTGWGILNMQERIQALGGKLQIDSEPGKGTNVSIEIRK